MDISKLEINQRYYVSAKETVEYENRKIENKDVVTVVSVIQDRDSSVLLHFENKPFKGHTGHTIFPEICKDKQCWWFRLNRVEEGILKFIKTNDTSLSFKKVNIEEI